MKEESNIKCKICGNVKNNKIYKVNERILNRGEVFNYCLCSKCQTLQLIDNIENMETYYSNYRVFKKRHINKKVNLYQRIKEQIKIQLFLNLQFSEKHMRKYWEEYLFLWALRKTCVRKTDSILDVGCGSGRWLEQLAEVGYKNLYGIDKFADNMPINTYEYRKGDLSVAPKKKYDIITFHHSFEHMDNPMMILQNIKSLLKDTGICIIRIPIFGKEMWKLYGTNWYQIDAPRHLFIYSEKAIKYLCNKTGLKIVRIIYDSDWEQIWYSQGYKNIKKSLYELAEEGILLSRKNWMQNKALELNKLGEGDQAIIYIKKINTDRPALI